MSSHNTLLLGSSARLKQVRRGTVHKAPISGVESEGGAWLIEVVGLSVVGTSPILVSPAEGTIVALLRLGSLVMGSSPDGLLVGAVDGADVIGAAVGALVGALDGVSVGIAVGFFVGAFDGVSVGIAVGFFVGAFDGSLVGSFVGLFVGFLVGTSVGS